MYNTVTNTVINAFPVVQYDLDREKRQRDTSRPRKIEKIMNIHGRTGSTLLGNDALAKQ